MRERIIETLKKENVFLTGPGGSGKSYLTEQVIYHYKKNGLNVVVLGSTGIAASNIGGQTIHSFFKIGLSNSIQSYDRFLKTMKPEIRLGIQNKLNKFIPYIDLIIIDEISMVSNDLMDLIYLILEDYNYKGKVMVVGDFYQLPPVVKNNEIKNYAFESKSWNELFKFRKIELTKIFRTKDIKFIEILNEIRTGKINNETIKYLEDLGTNKHLLKSKTPTILAGTNKLVNEYNKLKLSKINSPLHTYNWKLKMYPEGFDEQSINNWKNKNKQKIFNFCKNLMCSEELNIKVGCSIMFITNGDRWYNGEKGRVISIREDLKTIDECDEKFGVYDNNEIVRECLFIEKENGEIIELFKNKWEFNEYEINGNTINKKLIATVTQYPIKLSYAITIHKSQGMSIDNLICDVNKIFEVHQFYVSISRAVNPKNLYLYYKGDNLNKHLHNICIIDNKVREFYENVN